MTNRTFDFAVRRVVRVVDGDTYDLEIDAGFYMFAVLRFRLAGVDTPEVYGVNAEPAGAVATDFAKQWLAEHGDTLRVETHKTGNFGRWLGNVYDSVTGETLGRALMDAGLAEAY